MKNLKSSDSLNATSSGGFIFYPMDVQRIKIHFLILAFSLTKDYNFKL